MNTGLLSMSNVLKLTLYAMFKCFPKKKPAEASHHSNQLILLY